MQRYCPLCFGNQISDFCRDDKRHYLRCSACCLVSVPKNFHLDPEAEREIYDMHENQPGDQGYRNFLARLVEPMIQRLSPPAVGLDFGSGPGPTLSLMFEELGYSMEIYDKFYADDPGVLEKRYDFVTATEVLEHLDEPGKTLDQLWGLLVPGGYLGVMTQMLPVSDAFFSDWYYKRDPTHISFYSEQSFHWLAAHWGATVDLQPNIAIFKKTESFV